MVSPHTILVGPRVHQKSAPLVGALLTGQNASLLSPSACGWSKFSSSLSAFSVAPIAPLVNPSVASATHWLTLLVGPSTPILSPCALYLSQVGTVFPHGSLLSLLVSLLKKYPPCWQKYPSGWPKSYFAPPPPSSWIVSIEATLHLTRMPFW